MGNVESCRVIEIAPTVEDAEWDADLHFGRIFRRAARRRPLSTFYAGSLFLTVFCLVIGP
jgi:hypothetical protein